MARIVTRGAEGSQKDILDVLGRSRTYGRRRVRVERIDTHGAVVFLAGDRAYKLKRAVVFPYMDFSTPAKRLAVCRAEVKLNRRTAPALYLGLRAILPRNGELALGPLRQPNAIPKAEKKRARDWLVAMKRFPADALYDRIARRRGLRADEIDGIAEAIARFHARVPRVKAARRSRSLAQVVEGNLTEIGRQVPGLFTERDVRELARRSNAAVRRVRGLLSERRRAGFVRHAHGDLHLRNICAIDGRPVLFDALEFDPRLATVDVLYDLAFLLMDLEHRGLGDAANRLFNHYLALTVAPEGNALALKGLMALPLFLSSRAAIRAHTEAAAADAQPNARASAERRGDAKRYLRLALGFLVPPPPVLVAIGGLSGTGKTTLARALAPSLGAAPGAVVLRSDVIRKRLAGKHPLDRLPESAYGPDMTRSVYGAIARAADRALAAGHAVVADAVFAKPEERRAIGRVAARHKVPFVGLWLEAPPSTLVRRLIVRRNDASDATPAVLARQLDYNLGELTWTRVPAPERPDDVARRARRLVAVCKLRNIHA